MSLFAQKSNDVASLASRLTDLADGSDSTTARAGRLLKKLPQPSQLSDAALARIETRLLTSAAPSAPLASGAASVLRWLGLGAAAAVLVAAVIVGWRLSRPPGPASLALSAPKTAAEPAKAPAASPKELEVPPASQLPPPAPQPAAAEKLSKSRGSASRSGGSRKGAIQRALPVETVASLAGRADSLAQPSESGLLAESRLLGQALHQLHQEHAAQAALDSLSTYETRFPHGLLGEEAQAARVDALMALERRDEALALLDRATFARLARGGELRAVRGELRVASRRCREAIDDFTWALLHQPTTGTTERALYGRAACRAALHESDGARADYTDYLQRFPAGRFAGAARSALRVLASPRARD